MQINIEIPKDSKPLYILRENLKNELKSFVNKPIVNENDGTIAIISSKTAAKISSDKAISKTLNNGFSEAQHFATARKVGELFKKSKKAKTHDDFKHSDENVQMHRYIADFLLDNEPAQALITLKETLKEHIKGMESIR